MLMEKLKLKISPCVAGRLFIEFSWCYQWKIDRTAHNLSSIIYIYIYIDIYTLYVRVPLSYSDRLS